MWLIQINTFFSKRLLIRNVLKLVEKGFFFLLVEGKEESRSFLSAFSLYSFINNALLFKSHKIMGTVKTSSSNSNDKRHIYKLGIKDI